MKFNFGVFLFLFISCALFAGSLNIIAKKARMKTGKVTTFSPEAREKKDALKLSKGAILFLEPGGYRRGPLEITEDNIIIEGEMAAWCDIELKIRGKNCIVRNIWLNHLEAEEELTVVDSRIDEFCSFGDDRNKIKQYFINSCFNRLKFNIGNRKIFFESCTVVNYTQGDPAIMIFGGCGSGSLNFTNCVLSSDNFLMKLDCPPKNKIVIDDCLLFGKEFLAERQANDARNQNKKPKEASNLKELRRYCKVSLKGKNINKKPEFEYSLQSEYDHLEKTPGALFRLKENSPGKKEGMGVNLGENDFPTPP